MPSTILDDAGRLRQRWTQLVTDVTPSYLPSGLSPKRESRSPLGQLDVSLQLSLIQACCQQYDLSPLGLVQAAWAAVLRSYSGSDDVMFATIGLERPSPKQQWTNASISRARLDAGVSILSSVHETRQEGLIDCEAMLSVSEALQVFSVLDPKPCNSTIWIKEPLLKSEVPQTEICNEQTVSLPTSMFIVFVCDRCTDFSV